MTTQTNCSVVTIGANAEWSADRKTIFNALVVNGVSYDIQVDASLMGNQAAKDVLPSIQVIFQKLAEQGLTKEQKNSVMNCFYDRADEVAVLKVDNKIDVTPKIAVDFEKLRVELGEDNAFVANMGQKATARKVMWYVSERLLSPAFVATRSSLTPSKPITPPQSTADAGRYDRFTRAEQALVRTDAEVQKLEKEVQKKQKAYDGLTSAFFGTPPHKVKQARAALKQASEEKLAAELLHQAAQAEYLAAFTESLGDFYSENAKRLDALPLQERAKALREHRKSETLAANARQAAKQTP